MEISRSRHSFYGVALALHLITLAVNDLLTFSLAELTQHLKVNTIIAEFLFHIVVFNSNTRLLPQRLTLPSAREAHGGDVDGRVSGELGIDFRLHVVVG